MQNDKSLDNDGLTKEFHETLRDELKGGVTFHSLLIEIHSLLVTRCKITSYSFQNSLVTRCRSCLSQRSLITRCKIRTLLVAEGAR